MNIDSQKLTNVLMIGVFVILAYLAFSKQDRTVEMTMAENEKTIAVEGSAETFTAPDTASVSFSVTKKAQTTDIAMNSINERMDVLMQELKSHDVEKKDVKTVRYDVQPEYSYNDGKQVFEGYRAVQRVEVIIRDLDAVSGVLGIVNSANLDNVSQLSFFVDDEKSVTEKLRKEAIQNAKENAKTLAKDLGVNLHVIVGYSDFDDTHNQKSMSRDSMMVGAAMEESAPAVVPTGENQFTSHVTITYKID